MAYLRTIFHYYLWEGGGQEEGDISSLKISLIGGEGRGQTINEQFIKYTVFFEVAPKYDSHRSQAKPNVDVFFAHI